MTPLGNDAETTWQRLLAGESGAGPITQFDSTDYNVHFACEVKDFDPSNWIERKQARRMDRFAQLVLSAARQAEADSGVDIASEGDRVGASIATGIGGLKSFQDCYDTLRERGPDRVNPFAIPCIIPNMGAGLGLDGARDPRPALVRVHSLRGVEHGDRSGPGRHQARPG